MRNVRPGASLASPRAQAASAALESLRLDAPWSGAAEPIRLALDAAAVITCGSTELPHKLACIHVDVAAPSLPAPARRDIAAAVRAGRIPLLEAPPGPPAGPSGGDGGDRLTHVGTMRELAQPGPRRDQLVSAMGLAPHRSGRLLRDLTAGLAVLETAGLADHHQQRILVCDGSRPLCVAATFHPRPPSRAQERALRGLAEALRRRAHVAIALTTPREHTTRLIESLLAANPRPTLVVRGGAVVERTNPAASALIAADPAWLARALAAVASPDPAFCVTQVDSTPLQVVTPAPAAPHELVDEVLATLGLGPRTVEVVRLLARGLENKEIARTLGIADNTVEYHLTRAYTRAGVQTRMQLLALLLARGAGT
ncbi:MAG: helix-turn-helix transcriptional regulator [Kofleriaceae bacterium]|nr:helix-turn-helix transcriptional regulator [Kofleriaceae bacterium]